MQDWYGSHSLPAPAHVCSREQVLNTAKEIYANVYYRFLQIRGYIDASHKLTIWGRALQSALATSTSKDISEDTILLCVELLRLGLINDKDMFPDISGAPMRGNGELISMADKTIVF